MPCKLVNFGSDIAFKGMPISVNYNKSWQHKWNCLLKVHYSMAFLFDKYRYPEKK